MIFKSMAIDNFLSVASIELDLERRGLVLVQGANRDEPSASSNGSGKTTMLEALSWVLYGKTAKGLSADDVVSRMTKKNVKVALTLEDQGQVYIVRRYRKHDEAGNKLTIHVVDNGQERDLTLGTDKLTQERVERLVGCSYEVFSSAIYAGQERFPDLPSLTDKFLKVLIEEAAGIERLQRTYELARTKWNEVKRQHDELVVRRDQMTKTLQMLSEQHQSVKLDAERWQQGNRELTFQCEMQIDSLSLEVNDPEYVKAEQALNMLNDGLVKIQQKFNDVVGFQQEAQRLQTLKTQADQQLALIEQRVTHCQDEVEIVARKLQNLDRRIGQPCNECGKPYRPEDLTQARIAHEALIKQARERLTQIQVEQLVALEASRKASEALSAYQATAPKLDHLNALQSRVLADKATHERTLQQRQVKQRELDLARRKFQELSQMVNPLLATIQTIERQLADGQAQRQALEQSLRQVEEELLLAKDAVEVFGPTGVRAQILDTVTPFLNERTETYLDRLSDGNIKAIWQTLTRTTKGELREKFCIDVQSSTGGEGFKALSGGEKRKVRLATAMALSDLMLSRATKPLEIAIYDEVDSGLDPTGLERLMEVLKLKANERGTLLVISHSDLSSYIDNVIMVEKRNGQSRLV